MYEYVNNGNLEQWLHGDVGPCSPLTWEVRINIILGMAKGYNTNQIKFIFEFHFPYPASRPCRCSMMITEMIMQVELFTRGT